ncbi:MAG: DUF4013 domain-containing protein [Candidatus ainarchaeum sp.]|nr:DUF4013 domain-containing protein [Candidatus ainarchaeum sp.]
MDLQTAIKKPFGDMKTLAIGMILMIIPLVNILTIPGYILKLASKTMKGDKKLPKFENFGELVVDSLKAIVTLFIHGILFTIVATILAFIPIIGPILAFVWMIVFMFIMVSGVLTLAKTKSIVAAINVPELVKKAMKPDFIIAVIVAAIISMIISGLVSGILIAIFGAALLPTLMVDPAQLMNMLGALLGAGAIFYIVSAVLGFVIYVFFITLVAEAYK